MASFTTVPEAVAAYECWLTCQPLSSNTRRTYLTQVHRYENYLSTFHWEYGHPLQEPHARDYAVRDYKTALKVVHHAKPSTVNLALAAVDHFYRFLELPTPHVTREDLPTQAPRGLEQAEQKRFLRAVERCSSVRDRAIALLLFYTGLRISECCRLTHNLAKKGRYESMPEQMLFMYVIHLPWRPSGAGLRPVKNQDTGAIAWKDVVLIHKFAALAHIIA